jgi:hypothetical protein
MSRRTRRDPESSPRPAPRGLHVTQRLAIVLGLVAVIVVSLVGAAAAGVFSPVAKTGAARPAAHRAAGPARKRAAAAAAPSTTSCTSVAHIGDSTSVGMVAADVLPDPAQRLAAQYADVGVKHARIDASGGRSIVEQMPDQLNGDRVAQNWLADGYHGCWVFALGTNDTANVSVGSHVSLTARIAEMMSAAHGEPVLWVNTQTDLSQGPWSEANMQLWNNALVSACKTYPNMRIFNWAAMVQPAWHLPDGIHYTPAGYAIRAHAIAGALVRAFPAGGHSSSCVVS